MADLANNPELSVIVPVKDEAGNVAPLVREIETHLLGRIVYEIIIVDDGSEDGTGHEIRTLSDEFFHVHCVRHERCCGQSQATISGVLAASGEWIATIDGDGQNLPADIVKLLDARSGPDASQKTLFIGNRADRKDSLARRIVSKIANGVRGLLLRDHTPDSGCGLKLLRRDLFLALPQFDALHRFTPALVIRAGGRVTSVPIGHLSRRNGVSKYGIWLRGAVGLIDMLAVAWLQVRHTKPTICERYDKAKVSN
jgi:dolichol-phosphate mannosyltransferase